MLDCDAVGRNLLVVAQATCRTEAVDVGQIVTCENKRLKLEALGEALNCYALVHSERRTKLNGENCLAYREAGSGG